MFARILALSLGLSSLPLVGPPSTAAPEEERALPDTLDRLQELEAVVRPTADRLLACTTEEEFLAATDAELLRLESLSLLLAIVLDIEPDELATRLGSAPESSKVLDDLAAVTATELRDELVHGITDAAKITALSFSRENVDWTEFRERFANRPRALAASALAELNQAGKPLTERLAGLAVLRSNISMFVLASASETGSPLPRWMADLCIRLWRQGHEQILAQLEHRPAPSLREERLTAISAVLLSFVCDDPEHLGSAFRKHPTLAPMLQRVAVNLPRFFPEGAIDHLRVRPSAGTDSPEEDVVVVDVFVHVHDAIAQGALDRFDEEWWLEASTESTAEIVVDIRRT